MREEIYRIERLKKLRLKAKAVLEGTLLGIHASPMHGYSSEFREHREYSPGDDIRYIDFKIFARKDKLFTKKFSEETNTKVYLILDSSNSMEFGEPSKFEYSKVLLVSLAFLFQAQRDSPGLFVFSDREKIYIPPSSTRVNVEKIVLSLENLSPYGKTKPFEIFLYLTELIKKRSIIFLFTDFYHAPFEFIKGLKYLRSRKNEIFTIHMLSKSEFEGDFRLPFILKDSESGEEFVIDDKKVWVEMRDKLKNFVSTIKENLLSSGIKVIDVFVEDPYESNLMKILRTFV